MTNLALSDREQATVLAALRFWQRMAADVVTQNAIPEDDIATNGGTLDPLEADDIDGLCETDLYTLGVDR